MIRLVVILSIALAGVAGAGVITHFKMSGEVEELDSTIRQQQADLDKLSETVKQMSQVVRQVIAINSMRNGDEDMFEDTKPLPDRQRAGDGSLEEQVDDLTDLIRPYRELMDQQMRRREMRAAARKRSDADKERYSQEELDEMRELYRGSRGRWGSPEHRNNLEQLVEKYPESSMAGCAVLQMARGVSGEQAADFYLKAIDSYSDSYCFGGTQVGAIARDRLADHYEKTGQAGEAKNLRNDLKDKFPGAVDHRGDPL